MIAYKYIEDDHYLNDVTEKIFGLRMKELNEMEWKFLPMIGFKAHLDADKLENFSQALIEMGIQSNKRKNVKHRM